VTQEKLDIEIRKPAEAAAYAQVKQAEGARDSANAEAEADAYRRTTVAEANKKATVLDAEGEQQRVELSARAEATAIKVKGEAQADATTAVGTADAVAIEKKADALSKYGQAALQQEAINKMPQVASAIAAALGGIGTLTVISKDGPSAIANSVADIASDVPTLLKNLTGVDLSALLSGIAGGSPAAGAVASLEARQPPA
jgi:flotillin